jgi:hypothetical protein
MRNVNVFIHYLACKMVRAQNIAHRAVLILHKTLIDNYCLGNFSLNMVSFPHSNVNVLFDYQIAHVFSDKRKATQLTDWSGLTTMLIVHFLLHFKW